MMEYDNIIDIEDMDGGLAIYQCVFDVILVYKEATYTGHFLES